jgi:hypothetical protein
VAWDSADAEPSALGREQARVEREPLPVG